MYGRGGVLENARGCDVLRQDASVFISRGLRLILLKRMLRRYSIRNTKRFSCALESGLNLRVLENLEFVFIQRRFEGFSRIISRFDSFFRTRVFFLHALELKKAFRASINIRYLDKFLTIKDGRKEKRDDR